MQPIFGLVAALLVPVAVAVLVAASESLTSPAHAERRSHARGISDRWRSVEIVLGCLFAVAVAVLLGAALAYLWVTRPPW